MKNILYKGWLWCLPCMFLFACRPISPITSSVTIDLERLAMPVNKALYGLTLEDVNHAIDGGLYAELIRNRDFEDGLLPEGCLYDAAGRQLITPAGWNVPFVAPEAVPGWHLLSEHTWWYLNVTDPVNEKNRRSLGLRVDYSGRGGGVVAEGFHGIGLRKGEQYELSFYLRGGSYATLTVGLRDSMARKFLSDTCRIRPTSEWTPVRHTFTATGDMQNATLVFSADSGLWFYLDKVSLFPRKTWKGQPNGLRADLMDALAALNPKFVRFPGGSSVEGYSIETASRWEETIGPVNMRQPAWSIWGYGVTNGMGFHEYLQLCEDLNARPIYVTNAGMLNQRYRLRYEEIKNMDVWAERLENALAYANAPVDSTYGRMRADNGHAAPFGLHTVEIGHENNGVIYNRRYRYLRQGLKERFPEMSLICNDSAAMKGFRGDWIDTHYAANVDYLISSYNCFEVENRTIHTPITFVGEFGAAYSPAGGTLRAAIGEAAFLIGAERNPMNVKGIAYAPLLGHAGFPSHGVPAIEFDAARMVKSPSYHVLEMFANHRGDELLVTNTQTFHKPLVTLGRVSVIRYGDAFEVDETTLNGQRFPAEFRNDRRTAVLRPSPPDVKRTPNVLSDPDNPDAPQSVQHRRYLMTSLSTSGLHPLSEDVLRTCLIAGDSMTYNYTFSAGIKRTQENGKIQLQVRDNGLVEELRDCIALTITDSQIGLYHCAGRVERPLTQPVALSMAENRRYTVKIVCENEQIRCYVDDVLLIEATVFSSPSLVTVATRESETGDILLKVVNTTWHEEWTSLRIAGGSITNRAEVIQLTGPADSRNTLEYPDVIVPVRKQIKFSFRRPIRYVFPANSVTIIRLHGK
ncbi:MAG: glycoside hydrolase [Tannerella sp.]|nr:glycoside hydrolase [Tannerella sp.]